MTLGHVFMEIEKSQNILYTRWNLNKSTSVVLVHAWEPEDLVNQWNAFQLKFENKRTGRERATSWTDQSHFHSGTDDFRG